ncbi:MAG TPA: aspartate-semialdehyde dehydrogenase [Longimicrobium sp.]|nr:aspartate-semialdehyde dehydrogenase [Longimicrobium sp.]
MHVAVLGATGAVGRTMLEVLNERRIKVHRLTLLASERSAGTTLRFGGRDVTVEVPRPGVFQGVDVALFSAGADRSNEWGPRAADEGAVVIDNSSAFRMDPQVPLVVPEVNPRDIAERPKGIIANPNCSTIQMVVALQAIRRAAGLTRVVATTYQSVSGAGETGRDALRRELGGEGLTAARLGAPVDGSPFTRRIAGNVIPQIGDFDGEGWTGEERKMINETRKILGIRDLPVTATCVRVPVEVGHSVQVTAETEKELTLDSLRRALVVFPGILMAGGPQHFPTPYEIAGRNEVFVGRVRSDPDIPRTFHLWVVADNLRKGAATNAVQILERLGGG